MSENPMVAFKRQLERVADELPHSPDLPLERMISAAVVAATKDPALLSADRASFFEALRQCATDGLVPDGVEAHLAIHNDKRRGKIVRYGPMVRGIIKRLRNSNKIKTVRAEVVYEGEQFRLFFENGRRVIMHEVNDWLDREGAIRGAYAVAELSNGGEETEVLTRQDIAQIRGTAKMTGVWDAWPAEKAKVAALRRLSKRLPVSSLDLGIIMGDEHEFNKITSEVVPPRQRIMDRATAKPTEAELEAAEAEALAQIAHDDEAASEERDP